MPATNREPAALATTPGWPDPTARAGSGEYFNGLLPVPSLVEAGLALFAIFIILRYCERRVRYLIRDRLGFAHRRERQQQQQQQQQHYRFPVSPRSPAGPTAPSKDYNFAASFLPANLAGPTAMDEKRGAFGRGQRGSSVAYTDVELGEGMIPPVDRAPDVDAAARHFIMSRPPPAPPLTPPELSSAVFTFHGGGIPSAASDSFMHQPNPDYMSSSGTSQTSSQQSTATSPSTTRRRSYHKTVPGGDIPLFRDPTSASESGPGFAPRSYPSTNPLLPPDPAGLFGSDADAADTAGHPAGDDAADVGGRGIDVRGEIVSVLDDAGAGWTRHTRVYGGGICLACAAAGREHGSGGYYGATVTPEEMR